jgi:ABC-type nitrate/sulfonate/bicarbonate transport system permease component
VTTVIPVIPDSETLRGMDTSPEVSAAAPAAAQARSFGMRSLAHSRRFAVAVVGPVLLLLVWELLALTVFAGKHSVPTPVGVVRSMWADRSLYADNAPTTLREAGLGYLWGNLAALGLAAIVSLVPFLEKTLLRIAITSYCLPVIAIAPVLNIVLNGDAPKATLAALSVFFTTLVGALLGLRSADANSLDVVRAYGGGRWSALQKVRLRAALPATFAGLRIAAPAALLGAIIGEYLGGDSGLGIAMINSEQALEINRTWGIAMFVTIVALLGYIITELIARWLTPWAPRSNAASGRSFRR